MATQARALLEASHTGTVEISASEARWRLSGTGSGGGSRWPGDLTLLGAANTPPPRMIDFAAALVRGSTFLGYHVTVFDARLLFATRDRAAPTEADCAKPVWVNGS